MTELNSTTLILDQHYKLQTILQGSLFTHQRVCNKPFGFLYDRKKQDAFWQNYRLFWTLPGTKCYFPDETLKYTLQANRDLKGIYLLTSQSDILDLLSPPEYDLTEYSDPFFNAWFAILQKDALGFPVDLFNLYDHQILFAKHGEFLEIVKHKESKGKQRNLY